MANWKDPIRMLFGVGPKQEDLFEKLGLSTVKDLFFHFPFRYNDIQERSLESIIDQEKVTLKGRVVTDPVVSYFGRRKNRLSFRLELENKQVIQVVFFNQAYLSKQININQLGSIYGKWDAKRQCLMGMKLLKESNNFFDPIYSTTQGLKQSQIKASIVQAFKQYGDTIEDHLPHSLVDQYEFMPLKEAIYELHFPSNPDRQERAKQRIVYQEFFAYQWRIHMLSYHRYQDSGIQITYDLATLKELIQGLPYQATEAQKKAVNEICYDLLAPYSMQRMLQGDVGSGKTLVAFLGALAAISAGYQVAMMVPTEILAKQHYLNFRKLFPTFTDQSRLLVSQLASQEKETILQEIEDGRASFIIGTHALIQDRVRYHRLGLVIIDEQHRFGVGQRQSLASKATGVNVLQMTATPIPRSLALSLYGGLAVSSIDRLPSGRKPIQTFLVHSGAIDKVYQQMAKILSMGQQIYYVLPIISESDHLDQVENVLNVKTRLDQVFSDYEVGLLHGQMSKDDQVAAMEDFKANQTQILVATTMVEVGVDVPNASMIVIQSAERFGLAQLHQLRGRVGRGKQRSYCFLIADPKTDVGKERLNMMVKENDGFAISQADMKLRGLGDLWGDQQSGLPVFHYANIFDDQDLLQVASQDAKSYRKSFDKLSLEDQAALAQLSEVMEIQA